ncbi:MAG: class II glutamine amidotransferase [Burkholderiaceae bacterium]|nr:class II glutamine amidotransferase [Burkholderiaceae bacterium]
MCELFGWSSKHPRSGRALPMAEFRSHAGETADNPDGWGVAWREEKGFLLEREPLPGCNSARFDCVIDTLRSDLIVAHIRKARWPPVNTLNNTHPFVHECCGRPWAFAHNGMVPDIVALEAANDGRVCRPEGQTDSESAFCHLMSHVTGHYPMPGIEADWLDVLGAVSEEVAGYGKFNFLLSDGDHLIAYGHDRLHFLESTGDMSETVLIATEPLSGDAGWTPFEAGELRIYRAGARVGRISTSPSPVHNGLQPRRPET